MWNRASGWVVAMGLLWMGAAEAQTPALPDNPRFVFPTTPEVVVKLVPNSTTRSIRGKLKSLTALEVVVDVGKTPRPGQSDAGQRIGFDRIESLRSSDGRLEFTPDEDFQAISQRIVVAYASVTIESAAATPGTASGNPSPTESAHTAEGPSPTKKPPVNGLGQGGFGGLKNLSKPKKSDPASSETPAETGGAESTPDPANPPPVDPTAGATEVLFCSNCTKEIPASAIKTGVCPHCKVAFSNLALPPTQPVANPFNPSAKPGPAGSNPFAANPSPTSTPTPPTNSGSQVIQGSSFTLDAIPNWAKGGLFVLLVLIGWHLIFNR